jgi:biopolymer transport protein ExbD
MSRFKSVEVEENVACNLIPMIDIMFLMLLFFMLSADMSQREIEDVKLPVAEQVKEDPKKEGYETTTVNVVGEQDRWFVKISGRAFTDWGELRTYLSELAQASPEPGSLPGSFYTSRAIMLRADAAAPYREVQRLIQLCSKVGFYKIEVGAAKPMPEKT